MTAQKKNHWNDPSAVRIPTYYYQQFDADFGRDVPAEGYGGWKKADLELNLDRTALVVMHAWDSGRREEFPGWYRTVEYIPRANRILEDVFPRLLAAVRSSPLKVFHVVGNGNYYQQFPGYQRAVALAGPPPPDEEKIPWDPVLDRLAKFKAANGFPGQHNRPDVDRGFKRVRIADPALPVGEEGVAENTHQLFALCKDAGVNHLIYTGFAVNWCLLMSPGGMIDMSRRGLICSAIRQAVTAVENRESARDERGKEMGLWRIAVAFGFIYDLEDFLRALSQGTGFRR